MLGCLAKAMPKANVRPEVCVGRFFYSNFYGTGKWLDKNCYPQAQTKLGKKQMVPGVKSSEYHTFFTSVFNLCVLP